MQDESWNNETIIELVAKSLDEPLLPDEQAQLDRAMENSPALRVVADGLQEFDALLKRTGMAIPEEGFPARVFLRIEAYERARTRKQWYLTLGMLALGLLAACAWVALNWGNLIHTGVMAFTDAMVFVPLVFTLLAAAWRAVGQVPLLLFTLSTVVLTLLWLAISGGFHSHAAHRVGE